MLSSITGTTDVYLILGDPVEQVRAPESFNLIFRALGMDAVMVPVQVPASSVRDLVRSVFSARNIKGLLLTIPHKSLVMDMLDECSELGQLAGAVNAVRCDEQGRLRGDLFDGEGLVSSLNTFNIRYTGKRVLLLGAGGAAEVALYDPTSGKAQALARRLGAAGTARVSAVDSSDPAGFDVVVNASPLGLQASGPMPCDVSRMAPHAALVDILMKNQPTPLVRAARSRGLVAQPGFEMLVQQAHLYLDFFGLHAAARTVEHDAGFIRKQIYPAALQGEIPLFDFNFSKETTP
jgi:shikimate dehydrogenase